MIQAFTNRLAVSVLTFAILGVALANVSLGNVAIGVGNNPPLVFGLNQTTGVFNVGTETNPIQITLDPTASPWSKQFVIPETSPIIIGAAYPVLESLLVLPDPNGLPLTDWHEQLQFLAPFTWSATSQLVIHDPLNPNGPPLMSVLGALSDGDKVIQFGPFSPISVPAGGLPISITKNIKYVGLGLIPSPHSPYAILVEEFPTTVPEPATLASMFVACGALALFRRCR